MLLTILFSPVSVLAAEANMPIGVRIISYEDWLAMQEQPIVTQEVVENPAYLDTEGEEIAPPEEIVTFIDVPDEGANIE